MKYTIPFFIALLALNGNAVFSQQISIDAAVQYQTIDGFAASDCWTVNYVGKNWSQTRTNQLTKWLFSQNTNAQGTPEGIGLSMWRVNLGAGTAEQGDDSGIPEIARRAECFIDAQGNYDWTKQAGQQLFMQKAKEYGCESFVLFSNSPPVFYTRNGKGYASIDGNSNLKADSYDDFADYLATAAKHFIDDGYNVTHISPVNEPQWDWNGTDQEGSPWQNSEIKKLTLELNNAILQKGIDTKILITEAGQYDRLYQGSGRASGQINAFFNATSENYVGNLPAVAPVIAGHGYWTYGTNVTMKSVRNTVYTYANARHVGVYQTEWSMLGDPPSDNFPVNYDSASYNDIALIMAKNIYADLAYANVRSWSFWTSMDVERYSQKNRFMLIALKPGNPPNWYSQPITASGEVYDRPNLWALGNFSFFVRPGYKRLKVSGADNLGDLMGTAFIAPDSSRIVSVYVNLADTAHKVKTAFLNMGDKNVTRNNLYLTNGIYKLYHYTVGINSSYSADAQINIPARSVATIVFDLENPVDKLADTKTAEVGFFPNPASDFISVSCLQGDKIEIIDLQGNVLYSGISEKNDAEISVAHLKTGIYALRVGVKRLKLIKE
jgi:O-glycosyl hydrolase